MARSFTLAQLRTAVQRRGGVERSFDLTPEILDEFINSAIAELWDKIRKKGDDSLVVEVTAVVPAGVDEFDLPSNFYKLRVVQIDDATTPSGRRRLMPFTLESSHLYGPNVSGKRYRYRMQGSLFLLNYPAAVTETLHLFYVPFAPILDDDLDTFDGFNGYEEMAIAMAWRKCVERQRLDTSGIDREIDRLMMRVSSDADGRDTEPFSLDPRGSFRYDELDDCEVW